MNPRWEMTAPDKSMSMTAWERGNKVELILWTDRRRSISEWTNNAGADMVFRLLEMMLWTSDEGRAAEEVPFTAPRTADAAGTQAAPGSMSPADNTGAAASDHDLSIPAFMQR